MITGYNTDIRHREVVFHVQTEDKGEQVASVESLVYLGGRVLARRQVTYRALLARGESRTAIARLMDRQHRLMISQIRGGRFDPDVVEAGGAAPPPEAPERPDEVRLRLQPDSRQAEPTEAARVVEVPTPPTPPAALQPPAAEASQAAAVGEPGPIEDDEPDALLDALAPPMPSARELGLPAPAPETVLSLDQVIFDYLATIAVQEQLVLLMDESPALACGSSSRLEFRTHTSRSGQPIPSVLINVRMISTLAPPRTLASGETDLEGLLRLTVAVPEAAKESAALIITAASPLGDAEIKQLL